MKTLNTIVLLALIGTITNAQYTKLLDFSGTINGSNPNGSLISDGTYLYGMTQLGGTNSKGTIFKIKQDGAGYAKLNDFSGELDGSNPLGSLIFYETYNGTYLYGMTHIGGTYNSGVIFKLLPNGAEITKLLDFNSYLNSGRNPRGSLISVGADLFQPNLFGMTYYGGNYNMGEIFSPNVQNQTLLNFSGSNYDDGRNPEGSLISDGTFLYGMTSSGCTNNKGVIFKIELNGNGYFPLHCFGDYPNDGGNPRADLVSDGTFLYGMTSQGGTYNLGIIFKIKLDGTGYSKLLDFSGASNGSYPNGSLISDGIFLYGMTSSGGTNDFGTIFKIKPDGSEYSKLLDFAGTSNGSYPNGSLISDGTFLYGMTYQGGANDMGTIFKYNLNCSLVVDCNVSPSTTVCAGTSVTLTGSGATSYVWTGGVTDGISFVPSATLSYTVTGTDINGCSATSSPTTISVISPSALITPNSATTFCQGDSVILTASSANSYLWNNSATEQSIAVSSSGNYSVTVTDSNECSATSSTINVSVNSIPSVSIVPSDSITFCHGDSVILTSSLANSYLWNNNATTQSITVFSYGNYSVTVTDLNGCLATSTATKVTVNSLPTIPIITANGTILTSISATGNQWYLNENIINGATSQNYLVTQNGNYTVVVTDNNSCSATSVPHIFTTVSILDLSVNNSIIIIPNPNNGIFRIETKNIQFSKIKIYNTIGEIIYESQKRNSEIDLSGQPKGTYFINVTMQGKTYNEKLIIQ